MFRWGLNDSSGVPAYAARSIGFRNIAPYTESDGTVALYVGGVSAISLYNNLPQFVNSLYPAPQLLRSTDGVNFTEVPHDPGTFLGDIVKNNTDIQVASFQFDRSCQRPNEYSGDGLPR